MLVEGAGSPAEINLRAGDIANMGFAAAADVPVVLAGDIDRGGVIASLAGTHLVLEPEERARIRGFVINKFRGDVQVVRSGSRGGDAIDGLALARRGAVAAAGGMAAGGRRRRSRPRPSVGFVARDRGARAGAHRQFRRSRSAWAWSPVSNWCSCGRARPIPANADVVILPGSKSTIGDLAFLRAQGWDIDIKAHVRRGGHVLGLCGGYQMLGQTIADPEGIEGPAATVEGLGLLDIATVMSADKSTRLVRASHCATGTPIEGYEIHLGRSEGRDCARPVVTIDGRPMARARPMDGCRARMSTACSPATPFEKRGWPISGLPLRWPIHRRSNPRSMRWPIIWKRIWISRPFWPLHAAVRPPAPARRKPAASMTHAAA